MKTMKIALLVILSAFLLTSATTNAQVKMEKGVKIIENAPNEMKLFGTIIATKEDAMKEMMRM